MRTLLIAGVAAGSALTFAPAAHAAPSPRGCLCGFNSVPDPHFEGSMTAVVEGGPVLWTDDTDPTVTYAGSVTCSIRVNDGGDACAVTSSTTPVVAYVAGTCTYSSTTGDYVYLCTSVHIEGYGTLYWDSANNHWSSDPNATCPLAIIEVEAGPGGGPIY